MPRRKRKFITQRKGKKQGGPNEKRESASEVFSHKDCKVAHVGVKKVRHQGEQAERSCRKDNCEAVSNDSSRNNACIAALRIHLEMSAKKNERITILDVGTGAHALWLEKSAKLWEVDLKQDPKQLLLLGIDVIRDSVVKAMDALKSATKSEFRMVNKFSFDVTPSDFGLHDRKPHIDVLVHEPLGNTMSTEGMVGTSKDTCQKFDIGVSVPFSASTETTPITRPAQRHLNNCFITERLMEGRGFGKCAPSETGVTLEKWAHNVPITQENMQTASATFNLQKHGSLFGTLLWLEVDCLGPHAPSERSRKKAHIGTLNDHTSNWKEVVVMLKSLCERLADADHRCTKNTEVKSRVSHSDDEGLPTRTVSAGGSSEVFIDFNDFDLTCSEQSHGKSAMCRFARMAKRKNTRVFASICIATLLRSVPVWVSVCKEHDIIAIHTLDKQAQRAALCRGWPQSRCFLMSNAKFPTFRMSLSQTGRVVMACSTIDSKSVIPRSKERTWDSISSSPVFTLSSLVGKGTDERGAVASKNCPVIDHTPDRTCSLTTTTAAMNQTAAIICDDDSSSKLTSKELAFLATCKSLPRDEQKKLDETLLNNTPSAHKKVMRNHCNVVRTGCLHKTTLGDKGRKRKTMEVNCDDKKDNDNAIRDSIARTKTTVLKLHNDHCKKNPNGPKAPFHHTTNNASLHNCRLPNGHRNSKRCIAAAKTSFVA
eukprot:jgi/Bigna1/75975/fgenesh1_pg.38_\